MPDPSNWSSATAPPICPRCGQIDPPLVQPLIEATKDGYFCSQCAFAWPRRPEP